jgi:hypothetical protein
MYEIYVNTSPAIETWWGKNCASEFGKTQKNSEVSGAKLEASIFETYIASFLQK